MSDFDIIKSMGMYQTDLRTREKGFTVAAVLCFGKDDIIIKQKEFIPALFKAFNEISDNAIDELTQLKKKDKKVYLPMHRYFDTFVRRLLQLHVQYTLEAESHLRRIEPF